MAFKDEYEVDILVNEAERLVLEEMEKQLVDHEEVCRCQDCILDIAALALNNLKPIYRSSLIGTLYAHALDESDYHKEVELHVREAIFKISKNPSH